MWGSDVSFNGDGEWINVFKYDTEQNLNNSGMILISEENVTKVNNQIQNFIQQTISLYRDEEKTKLLEQIQLKLK